MIHLPEFEPYSERYSSLQMEGLRVTCTLRNDRIAGFDPIYFDNVVAAGLVREVTQGRGLPNSQGDCYDIPLPLATIWQHEDGRRLWASSCLMPTGEIIEDRVYLHKRRQTGRYTKTKSGKLTIDPQRGRWMERRYVVKADVCHVLEARVIGHAESIAELLTHISHIGKYRNAGFGDVEQWEIEPMEISIHDLVVSDRRLTRNMPVEALKELGVTMKSEPSIAPWTLPYWTGASMGEGYRFGSEVGT